jgi:hypothetical protein
LVAWIATVLLVGAVVFLNQFGKPAPREPVDPAAETIKAPGILNSTAVVSKMVVKLVQVLKSQQEGEGTLNGATFLPRIDEQAKSPVDRLRVAMVAGELAGPEAALKRLADLEQRTCPKGSGRMSRRFGACSRPNVPPNCRRIFAKGWSPGTDGSRNSRCREALMTPRQSVPPWWRAAFVSESSSRSSC